MPMSFPSFPDPRGLAGPVLLAGDSRNAFRDPAALWHAGVLHLFLTWVYPGPDGEPFLVVAKTTSADLRHWSPLRRLTPEDRAANYSSPGSVVRHQDAWYLALQTYPRPRGEKYGNQDSRIWTMRSTDLENWEAPTLLRVKGPEVPFEAMGRMIDPFLLPDRDDPGQYWCFFKQNGVSLSRSNDLESWTFEGHTEAGENACVLVHKGDYWLFHSPENGIGVKRSHDLRNWQDLGVLTLGQDQWPWARGRLTAGFVLDGGPGTPGPRYLMFFHGSGPENEETLFDSNASIGIAYSHDLKAWNWPGESGL